MMKVKGAGIKDIPAFVKEKFSHMYNQWFAALPKESQDILGAQIMSSQSYAFESGLKEPIQKMVEIFWANDPNRAEELGRFMAADLLAGVYKNFVQQGSPGFLIRRVSSTISSYYFPSKCEITDKSDGHFVFQISEFPEIFEALEHIFSAWLSMILEACGCQRIIVAINKSIAKGDPVTEYEGRWHIDTNKTN